jgi:hypothetical protein
MDFSQYRRLAFRAKSSKVFIRVCVPTYPPFDISYGLGAGGIVPALRVSVTVSLFS